MDRHDVDSRLAAVYRAWRSDFEGEDLDLPFWTSFRAVEDWPAGVMYTNICKVDWEGGSFIRGNKAAGRAFLDRQRAVVQAELEILRPDVCLFMTGPNYDWVVDTQFPGVLSEVRADASISARELAWLSHPLLPANSLRSYHPAYLVRTGRRERIETMRAAIEAMLPSRDFGARAAIIRAETGARSCAESAGLMRCDRDTRYGPSGRGTLTRFADANHPLP